jgi:hypothetical protein
MRGRAIHDIMAGQAGCRLRTRKGEGKGFPMPHVTWTRHAPGDGWVVAMPSL